MFEIVDGGTMGFMLVNIYNILYLSSIYIPKVLKSFNTGFGK